MDLASLNAALERGRYADAMVLLNSAIASAPSAQAHLERGRLHLLLGDPRAARADFNAASALDPTGSLGDAARAALLKAIAPAAPQPLPFRPTRSRPRRRQGPRWVLPLIIALVILSFACALAAFLLTGSPPIQ